MREEYRMIITPAISPNKRHYIQGALQNLGFNVWAGGTHTDMSSCDIAFYEDEVDVRIKTQGAELHREQPACPKQEEVKP